MAERELTRSERVERTRELLDLVKARTGWTWLRLANYLGVEPSMLYRWRDGSRGMEPVHGFNLRWLVAKESPVEGKPDETQYQAILDSLCDAVASAIDGGGLVEALDRRGLDAAQIPGCAAVVNSCLCALRDAMQSTK